MRAAMIAILTALAIACTWIGAAYGQLIAGVGSGDITPPIGELNMGGYADVSQHARGIHFRLKARAFIFASSVSSPQRFVYVSTDTAAMSLVTKKMSLKALDALFGSDKQAAAFYGEENVCLSATHGHSGTGGYYDDFLYQITSLGVIHGVREAIANGIAAAIYAAHQDLIANADSPNTLTIAQGYCNNCSINRSPFAYVNNPEAERAKYGVDHDEYFPVLTVRNSNRLRGVASWFGVHGTSMNETNELISGDNKGASSYFYENDQRKAGNPSFVAAFGQSNGADVSPNTSGGHCTDTGAACDGTAKSCGGNYRKCIARGPGYEQGGMRLSTKLIGTYQYQAAKLAAESPGLPMTGTRVDFRHAFVNMSAVSLTIDGKNYTTCLPSMGSSFAAGTIDGTATPLSAQGNNASSPFLNFIRDALLAHPPDDLSACQAPKPILLPTGLLKTPYAWQPEIVPLQMGVIGKKLAIVGLPSEITTMAGRRLREAVLNVLVTDGVLDADATVAVAGLANTYASYTSTVEEYAIQSYEGASTIYGPRTLEAYIQLFSQMAHSFTDAAGAALPAGTPPQDHSAKDLSLAPSVVLDAPPLGHRFGNVMRQPPASAVVGDVVTAQFACAHPRNGVGNVSAGLNGGPSFMTVERVQGDKWVTFVDDSVWDTTFSWRRDGVAASLCDVEWWVGETIDVPSMSFLVCRLLYRMANMYLLSFSAGGTYRFRYYGSAKASVPFVGAIYTSITGFSNNITISSKNGDSAPKRRRGA
ncbi:Neutral ceramidase [Irineochytrium annulatum]|nr:Neutral ceramidase [Irineochytrium annulatum]